MLLALEIVHTCMHTSYMCGVVCVCEQTKVMDIVEVYTSMVNSALFLDAYQELPEAMRTRLGIWQPFDDDILETSGVWLSQTVRRVR